MCEHNVNLYFVFNGRSSKNVSLGICNVMLMLLTGSYVDVTGMNGADRVACKTSVNLSVNLLTVILGAERREEEVSIRLNLNTRQQGYIKGEFLQI